MFLSKIQLKNFRNYSKLDFDFKRPITILLGNNAQGKTNFLESIYFLATSKSLKADRDDELILESEEFLYVEGRIQSSEFGMQNSENNDNSELLTQNSEFINLEIAMQKTVSGATKKIKVNGVPRRLSDYSHNLAVVFFRPEDIELVTGSPSLRRYYIDQVISQVNRDYKKTLSSYESIITRKNKILKNIREGLAKKEQLIYWIDQQILLGTILTEKRIEFFEFVNSQEKRFGNFQYEYLPSKISKERLAEYYDREVASASSLVGPHRDDFIFLHGEKEAHRDSFLEKKDLSKYGSRGEQRTAVLDLKLLEVEFIESKMHSRPILLLDDIFSELDIEHRSHVVSLSTMQQTVIATVEFEDDLKKAFKDNSEIIQVEKGEFKKESNESKESKVKK